MGYECRIGTEGEPIRPTDYLPRRLMGEYLAWFYDTLVADAPQNLEIVRHYAAAVDISPEIGGREAVLLDNGATLTVDHVVLTSGHTFNDEPAGDPAGVRYLRPYPVEYFDEPAPAGRADRRRRHGPGGVRRAHRPHRRDGAGPSRPWGDRKRYVPSGREPVIYLYSRSGVPYCAKSAHGVDPYGDYRAGGVHAGGVRRADPSRRVARSAGRWTSGPSCCPLLFAEMQARYYTHAAFLKGGVEESAAARDRPALGLGRRRLREGRRSSSSRCTAGSTRPATIFAGAGRHYTSGRDYQSQVYEMIETDLDEALAEGGSPVKAAQEVLRILRDQLRSVIEFGGLSLESYIDFQSNVRGRINRLEAGPPPLRSQQLLGPPRRRRGPDPVGAGPRGHRRWTTVG